MFSIRFPGRRMWLVLVAAILVSGCVKARTNNPTEPGTWTTFIDRLGDQKVTAMVGTDDGGFLIVGTTAQSGTQWNQALVIRIDASGLIVYERALFDIERRVTSPAAAARISGDNYVIVGEHHVRIGGGGSGIPVVFPLVFAIDGAGTVLWDLSRHSRSEKSANAVGVLPSGDILWGADTTVFDTVDGSFHVTTRAALEIVGPTGDSVNGIELHEAMFKSIWDLVPAPDGGVAIVGRLELGPFSRELGGYFARIDASGTVQTQRNLGTNNFSRPFSLSSDGAGGVLVAGARRGESWWSNALLERLSGSGELLWEQVYPEDQFSIFQAACPATSSGFFAAGDMNSNTIVYKVDDEGELIWQREFGGEGIDAAVNILATPDGGCVVAGNTSPGIDQESNIFIMKLNADGEADLWPWTPSP